MVNSFFGIGQTNTKPNSGFGALPNFNVTIDNFYEHLEKYYTSEEEHLDIEQESLSPKGHAIECHRGLFQRAMYDGRNNNTQVRRKFDEKCGLVLWSRSKQRVGGDNNVVKDKLKKNYMGQTGR